MEKATSELHETSSQNANHGPDESLDVVVIGGGIIGLAVARALALAGRDVVLLETEPVLSAHTSSRNSEVIHAGIYYPAGSRKARYCVEGKERLYTYCEERDIPHRRTGKLIVATRVDEVGQLEGIKRKAEENGVHDLAWLDADRARELEPEVRCVRALFSPSTGILDSHAFMNALRRDAEAAGAHVVLCSPVLAIKALSSGFEISIGGSDPSVVRCRTVVNAAGLHAQRTARAIEGIALESIPPTYFAKGHYFVLGARSPFSHLVYPVPVPGGLGIHVTLDMTGQARFGPDVSWVDGVDYTFDESRHASFVEAIRAYYPSLDPSSLHPGYTGIRPKTGPAGSVAQDFVIHGPESHGLEGLVCLYGIESPGLTASLVLADEVVRLSCNN